MKTLMGLLSFVFLAMVIATPGYGLAFCNPPGAGVVVCPIDETTTYLTAAGPSFTQDGSAPLIIDLQALGLTTGSVITLIASGDLCIDCPTVGTVVSPSFGGVFSSTNAFQSNSIASNRVLNAQPAPAGTTPVTTSPTINGGFGTDITQDFLIFQGAGTRIVLPNISLYRYLFVGILDTYYADNTDVDDNLQLTISLVPEPGTYALFLSGLGAFAMMRRLRRK
jgi:hypothetical protein